MMNDEIKRRLLEELMAMTGKMDGDRLPQQGPKPMAEGPSEPEGDQDEDDQRMDPRLLAIIRAKKGGLKPVDVGSTRG